MGEPRWFLKMAGALVVHRGVQAGRACHVRSFGRTRGGACVFSKPMLVSFAGWSEDLASQCAVGEHGFLHAQRCVFLLVFGSRAVVHGANISDLSEWAEVFSSG